MLHRYPIRQWNGQSLCKPHSEDQCPELVLADSNVLATWMQRYLQRQHSTLLPQERSHREQHQSEALFSVLIELLLPEESPQQPVASLC
ncbi:hypothetical protein D3C73_1281300 [compost metagenome]